jgi:hypothetical protein
MREYDAELRATLRQLPVPEPSSELLARILRSRAMGTRVRGPVGGLAVPWRWVAVAAAVTLLIGGSWKFSVWSSKIRESRVGARDPIRELLSGRLWSEESIPESPPARLPRCPLIRAGHSTARLPEGLWTYPDVDYG